MLTVREREKMHLVFLWNSLEAGEYPSQCGIYDALIYLLASCNFKSGDVFMFSISNLLFP